MAKRISRTPSSLGPAGAVTRSEFRDAHGSLKTEMGVMKTDIDALKADVSVLKTDVSVLKTDVSVLKTDVRALGVVLERVDSNVRALAEGMVSMHQGLTAHINDVERRLSARIDVLESVVRQNSIDIAKNSADIQDLRTEVRQLRHDFDHRAEKREIELLDARVTALETKARLRAK